MSRRPTLLVFVKYPEPGRVKTRLAQTTGPERAATLYRQWISTVLDQFQAIRPATRLVGYFDGAGHDAFRHWHALADEWWPQPAGDLGARLSAGLAAALDSGGPALAVGTDCLEITPDLVAQAFAALSHKDVVFGPTADGGYYLVGTAKTRPELFRSVRWSSPFTLGDHLRCCRREGWSVALLPRVHDVDTWDDWQAYLLRTGLSPGGAVPDSGSRRSHAE
jgi:rSAM/selenodomain-associated transferase 1